MEQIDVIEFTEAVLKMRRFQKQYAQTRNYLSLQAAEKAEKAVDTILEIYEHTKKKEQDAQKALF